MNAIYCFSMQGSARIRAQLRHWAKLQPDTTAIHEIQGNRRSMSYGELWQATINLQSALPKEARTILLALPNCLETTVVWLAALMDGRQLVPLSPDITQSELNQIADKYASDGSLLVGGPKTSDFPHLSQHHLEALLKQSTDNASPATTDGTVILSTSGSTGPPKDIALSASQCVITADNIIASHQLTNKDCGLTPLPFHHVNAPIVSLLSTILSGGQLAILERYRTQTWWHDVQSSQPTWISLVPTLLAMILTTEKPTNLNLSGIRFVRTASAPLPVAFLQQFESRFNLPVIETYGMTEAASTIAANPVPPGVHKPGSVGLPIGIQLTIVDPVSGIQCQPGITGEVRIKGPNVISAYVNNRDPEAFIDGWLSTGDLGYLDKDGYLFLTGRSKDIIIRGGENIFPREIEEVLSSYPEVDEAIVVGQKDKLYGEKVVAYIRTHRPPADDFIEQLTAFAAERLNRTKVPVEFHRVEDFPRTSNGKVNRPLLRQGGII